jgi:hypothetical protein
MQNRDVLGLTTAPRAVDLTSICLQGIEGAAFGADCAIAADGR